MIYGLMILVSASVATASVLDRCVCTREYNPMCGSDGKTYDNPCMLACAQTTNSDLVMSKKGPCPDDHPCVCTYEYSPVCGSDGKTYPNKCVLKCQRSVSLVTDGPCPPTKPLEREIPTCTCTRELRPICGSDGITYPNPCLFNCAKAVNSNLVLKSNGPCPDEVNVAESKEIPCACTRNMSPVCGSDGNTYNNPCLLNCATKNDPTLSIARQGACEDLNVVDTSRPVTVDPCVCTRVLAPVCGSDGVTYNNACIMRCRAPDARVLHNGPCEA